MPITYTYLPYIRRGIGATKGSASGGQAHLSGEVNLKLMTPDFEEEYITKNYSLYGPGEVKGISEKAIVREMPKKGSGNFEHNFLPFIEFREDDFLWRYSTFRKSGQWIPWLTLLVLERPEGDSQGEFVSLPPIQRGLPWRIEVMAGTPLPNLDYAWQWAHVQVIRENNEGLTTVIQQKPEQVISRLMCSRYLEAGKKYTAFVVPVYQRGVEAGRGEFDTDTPAQQLAWAFDSEEAILDQNLIIPYYYKWHFSTGLRGDFESLARLLEPRQVPNVGKIMLDCFDIGYSFAGKVVNHSIEGPNDPNRFTLEMGTALRSEEISFQKWGYDYSGENEEIQQNIRAFQEELAGIINAGGTGEIPYLETEEEEDPLISLPAYGKWYRPNSQQHLNASERNWYTEINLDPRHRAAAGIGAQLVKDHQEALMSEAWKQLEIYQRINQQLVNFQFGRAVSECLNKRIDHLSDDQLVRFADPITAKISLPSNDAAGHSVGAYLDNSRIPNVLYRREGTRLLTRRWSAREAVNLPANELRRIEQVEFVQEHFRFQGVIPRAVDGSGKPGSPEERVEVESLANHIRTNHLSTRASIELRVEEQLNAFRANERPADPLSHLRFYPSFQIPVSSLLLRKAQAFLLAGIDEVPQNVILKLKPNQHFVEALLIGMNHEFGAELRWRDYPTDLRGMFFSRFWHYPNPDKNDIKPIRTWQQLGHNSALAADEQNLILLIRSELINKYPNVNIYLANRSLNNFENGQPMPDFVEGQILPNMRGKLPPDMIFVGFNRALEELDNHYLVFEERIGETRFGLDNTTEGVVEGVFPDSWEDLSWRHLGVSAGEYIQDLQQSVFPHSGKIATVLTKRAFRLAIALENVL